MPSARLDTSLDAADPTPGSADSVRGVDKTFLRRLGAIVVAAMAWRLLYVHLELPIRVISDENWFVYEARVMFTNHPWTTFFYPVEPSALHGPLTSLIVSPFAWLFPHATVGLRNVIAVLGSLTVAVLGFAGYELGGPKVGLLAAGIVAVLPDFWIRDGLVVSEPVATFFVALASLVAIRAWHRFRIWHPIMMGALAGLVCLARPEASLAIIVIALLLCLRRGMRTSLISIGLVVTAAAIVLAPWFAYNQGRFKDTVFVSNNLGITLAGANCTRTYYNPAIMGYDSSTCWNRAYNRARKKSLDESVQSKIMRTEALHFIEHHLDRVPLVVVMREAWFLGVYRPGWSVAVGVSNGQPRWATWMQAISFYLVFPAAMWLWWRNRRRKWPHWIFGALIVCSFLVAAAFVGHWRYRVTLDVGMVLVLALGLGAGPRSETEAA